MHFKKLSTLKKTINWFGICVIWLYFLLWHLIASGSLSPIVALWTLSFLVTSWTTGDLFSKYILLKVDNFNSFTAKFLLGIICVNINIYFLSLLLPFKLSKIWLVYAIVNLLIWLYSVGRKQENQSPTFLFSEKIFIFIVPLCITGWCRDLLPPVKFLEQYAVLRSWPDTFYHVSQIVNFAFSQGLSTLSDVQMAGTPSQPYHLASYLLSAVLVGISDHTALTVYSSFMVPLGHLITGLAAFSLIRPVFGQWAALSASVFILILPDAFQQGFGNSFLGYHWLQMIAPAQGYGIGAASIVFLMMFNTSGELKYRFVFFGYFFLIITLLFKAQIFVAVSYLAFIYPFLFTNKSLFRFRLPVVLIQTVIFIGIVQISQVSGSVPTLRMDGSGFNTYYSTILNAQNDGWLKSVFSYLFLRVGKTPVLNFLSFALILLLTTFGYFAFLYLASLKYLKQNLKYHEWMLPVLVLAVYLIMATALAMDDRRIGTPEELQHRPFVWAYFIISIWSVAATYQRFFGNDLPKNSWIKLSFLCMTFILIILVPFRFGKGLQTMKKWDLSYPKIPICQYKAAAFIRKNSLKNDIVQDSKNDRSFILSSLTERKPYAIDTDGVRAPKGIETRLELLERIKKLHDVKEVHQTLMKNGIHWYVANSEEGMPWVLERNEFLKYECGEFKVYRF